MSVLTGRELEFLTSLNTRWSNLYGNELARLLKGDYTRCDGRHEPLPSFGSRRPLRGIRTGDTANATKT